LGAQATVRLRGAQFDLASLLERGRPERPHPRFACTAGLGEGWDECVAARVGTRVGLITVDAEKVRRDDVSRRCVEDESYHDPAGVE
jgi:hypothetical protein